MRVYQKPDGNVDGSIMWTPMGDYNRGLVSGDYFGYLKHISITHDGLTVAVGSGGYDKDGKQDRGRVQVYNHDSTTGTVKWNQIGNDLVGDNMIDNFALPSLSSDGKYLIGNFIITSFKDVELGNGQISTQVIDPDGRPTALASVSKLNEEMAIVNTRIISAFFDTSGGAAPDPINVQGTAIIGFKTTGIGADPNRLFKGISWGLVLDEGLDNDLLIGAIPGKVNDCIIFEE